MVVIGIGGSIRQRLRSLEADEPRVAGRPDERIVREGRISELSQLMKLAQVNAESDAWDRAHGAWQREQAKLSTVSKSVSYDVPISIPDRVRRDKAAATEEIATLKRAIQRSKDRGVVLDAEIRSLQWQIAETNAALNNTPAGYGPTRTFVAPATTTATAKPTAPALSRSEALRQALNEHNPATRAFLLSQLATMKG